MGFSRHTAVLLMLVVNARNLVSAQKQETELEPVFLTELTNITVPQGRDVSFICTVDNLQQYRVAWIKSDSKAILGIHTHMVSLNPRLSVSHNGYNTWKLLISQVQLNDSGSYMCQINTNPMKSVSGYLEVVVPPDILNQPGPTDAFLGVSNEGGTVQLLCNATGVPKPSVMWRREGGKNIVLRTENREKKVIKSVEGVKLTLTNVQRNDMGGYLCIASNGVPPSVSKRFDVYVHFPPSIKVLNQLVAAPVGSHVTLECFVEAYPRPLNGWYKDEEALKVHNGPKYNTSEIMINAYTWQMNLTIYQLTKSDFGAYLCSSVNALGKSDARVRLQELRLPKPKTTPIVIVKTTTTPKPTRKQPTIIFNKEINEVIRPKQTIIINHIPENITDATNNNDNAISPISTMYEHESTRNSHPPPVVPSSRSPGLLTNGAEPSAGSNIKPTDKTILFIYILSVFLFK